MSIKLEMDFVSEPDENSSLQYSSSGTVRAETSEPYHNVFMPSIYGVICFVGIIGNCIVIYTIVKKTKFRAQQTVPDIFIFSLSIVDLLFLLGMPFLIHQLVGNGSWCFGATMCTVITALDSNSQTVSTYILTVMTLDRYLATVHPIRFNHVRTPCMAVSVVSLVWILSLLSITPVWMYAGLMPLRDGSVGCALLLPNPSTDTYWFTLYQFVLTFALPLVVICVVFFKILKNMAATVAPLPQRSLRVRTRKVTRMAVAICLAFFICWAPYYILQLAHLGVQRPSFAFLCAYNIAISMGYANSCINPLLYIVLSETFKRQFIVAIRPGHRDMRAEPGMADGSVSMRLAPDGVPQSQSSRELLPVTVAVH
ncbi:melanin-concentrating hormone receptor 1 [Astyanax mexicanus]|uniref:melanin-concentrating hormone receptor 1 n=1 Tax=Astyanax mexicanus TaxID=7994 RepID=UPI0020CB4E0C|nr:melanin-concentrating hormone receptor 1 [Astyanax mexicanus]